MESLAGTFDLPELDSAEAFLRHFGIAYEPAIVQAYRLPLLRHFRAALSSNAAPADADARQTFYADCLARAYQRFANREGRGEPNDLVGSGCGGCQMAAASSCSPTAMIGGEPIYDYGAAVRVIRTIHNDGTVPGLPRGRVLVKRGSVGFVRNVGKYLQDQTVYSVHFIDEDRVVGCRVSELQCAEMPWLESRFEYRDKVCADIDLGISGEVLVQAGEIGEVMKVLRDHSAGVTYHVLFVGRPLLQVPETALVPVDAL